MENKKVKEAKSTFSSNLNKLIKFNNITQSELAKKTDTSFASISNYIKGISVPSIEFLLKLKSIYRINIDEFLTSDFQKENLVDNEISSNIKTEASKFTGNFILYFYVSSGYKGSGQNPLKDEIRYGVMSVYPNRNKKDKTGKLCVKVSFFKSRKNAERFKENIDKLENNKKILQEHNSNTKNYEGVLEASETHVFISVKDEKNKDKAFIIFNSPPVDRDYMGGLGTANSISTGREPSPVIQYILISRNILNIPEGEIYNLLSLPIDNIDITNETVNLLEQFKKLYLDENISLEEFEKKYIMQNNIEKVIRDVVKRNLFRYAKVSNREDDKYYRISMAYSKNKNE